MSTSDKNIPVKVLKQLMLHGTLTTDELMRLCECGRKPIYKAVDTLECLGFHIEIERGESKTYEYTLSDKIYGSSYD